VTRYAPWSVVWVNFDPHVGREQAGRRPAIIVGTLLAARIAERSRTVIVVPVTTTDRGLPWQPPVTLAGRPSIAMCEQIKSISLDRIAGPHRAATLTADEIELVGNALRNLIAI
jgi:mRNA interferase MazF